MTPARAQGLIIEPRPLDPESRALTIRPQCLQFNPVTHIEFFIIILTVQGMGGKGWEAIKCDDLTFCV